MNKKTKRWLSIAGLAGFVFILSGCTANFCSPEDQARIMYVYEGGDSDRTNAEYDPNEALTKIIEQAETQGIFVPSDDYWTALDARVLAAATLRAGTQAATLSDEEILTSFGYVKFLGGSNELWSNWDAWTSELKLTLGVEHAPDSDFAKLYKSSVNTAYANYRACIAINDGNYGPTEQYFFEAKTWGFAFERGLIEGLFVYPVAWLLDTFAVAFGMAGWGQVLAILLTTIIVRGILMAVTFKSTLGTQKMSLLQPELAKIQAKYPNSKTNQYEKQRLAQEQMELYKRNGVSPFSQIIVMFLQFPIFIAVWGAMTGSAILATGSFLGLNLNTSVGNAMMANFFTAGWWTAVILFILMGVSQFVAMKLPNWLQKTDLKKVGHTMKNPAADSQQKQMKLMSNVMLIMIIVMGFSLPSAMGIYWFIGALISVAQTFITRKVMARNK